MLVTLSLVFVVNDGNDSGRNDLIRWIHGENAITNLEIFNGNVSSIRRFRRIRQREALWSI